MMSRIYIDKRYFADRKAKWVSFEDTQGLRDTKQEIYGKCVPCITNLYEQLKGGGPEVSLGPAFRCWKVTAVLQSMDQCVDLLAELERNLGDNVKIKGRFGSVDEAKLTKVIVFNAANEVERKHLYEAVKTSVERVSPGADVSYHRGCVELYHELFGDWKMWKEKETIKKPESVPATIDKIRKVLFWDKESVG